MTNPAKTWLGIFGPPTDLEGLCVWFAEKVAADIVDLAWQPAWLAFEASFLSNNPPAVTSSNDTIYVFYPSSSAQTDYLLYNTYNGTTWSSSQKLMTSIPTVSTLVPVETATGAGATTFGGEVYVFWQDVGDTGVPSPDGTLMYKTMSQETSYQIQPTQAISGYSPGVIMSDCPSAVVFNDLLYVFYQGPGPDGQLWFTSSSDGSNWSTSTHWPNTGIATSPSAVVFTNPSGQEYLYVFYQNTGTGNLSYTSIDTAGNDAGPGGWLECGGHTVPMSGAPVALVYDDTLYVLFAAGSGSGFWYVSSPDGSTWNAPLQVAPVQLSSSPSLVNFNDQIYCMMQGPGNSGELWYTTTATPGNPASLMTKFPTTGTFEATDAMISWSPNATVFNSHIYCFYQQNGNTGALFYVTFGSGGWSTPAQLQAYSGGSSGITGTPGSAVFGTDLYVFYQGGNYSGALRYQTYDGSNWSTQKTVSGAGMSGWPAPVVFNNELYVFYEGEGNANALWYSVYNGSSWGNSQQVNTNGVSYSNSTGNSWGGSTGPAAIVYNGTLYVFYLGNGGCIFYNSFGNTNTGAPMQLFSGQLGPETFITAMCAVAVVVCDDSSGTPQLYCVYQSTTENATQGYKPTGDLYYVGTSDPASASSWSAPVKLGSTVPTPNPPGGISTLSDWAVNGVFAMI
ncbi:hypothetical protein [Pseudomonas purpurea]|uniref:hypothetical protein n=1 Tax=Pseudomonas purpurea TaxID=3136737 RepID=UPI003264B516